ncbi:hypothetical protein [Ruegeria sp. SCP11]|uniref:hypothetical protein n=1 Tax=Ruegeria sp. SCP11 TaxID=3141378 RepID=UPI00333A9929
MTVSTIVMKFILSGAEYAWVMPNGETTKTLLAGWIGRIWLRNFLNSLIEASGLHLWFYNMRLNPCFSHSGFEAVTAAEKNRLKAGKFLKELDKLS